MAVWPAELPQSIHVASHTEVDVPAVARFQTSAGPAQLRRIATLAPRNVSGKLVMSLTQLDVLNAFFRDTCKMGTLPFEWKNHLTGNVVTYRWRNPPPVSPLASRTPSRDAAMCEIQLELEMFPWTEITGSTPTVPPVPPAITDLLIFPGLDTFSEPAEFVSWEPEPTPFAAPEDPLVLIFTENSFGTDGQFVSIDEPAIAPTGTQSYQGDGGNVDPISPPGSIPLIVIM